MALASKHLILTGQDEEVLSGALLQALPSLVYVNGIRWAGSGSPLVSSISKSSASRVLLWDQSLFSELPSVRNSDGSSTGPSARYVISLDKSRLMVDHMQKEIGFRDARVVLVSGGFARSGVLPCCVADRPKVCPCQSEDC